MRFINACTQCNLYTIILYIFFFVFIPSLYVVYINRQVSGYFEWNKKKKKSKTQILLLILNDSSSVSI